MARTFGKLLCTIWTDPDFLALTPNAKVLFCAFISQDDISAAGILPLTERRWRKWIDGTQQAASDALDELEKADFVQVDEDTAEVWIRSFIKHDGRLGHPKLGGSVTTAAGQIRSETLRNAVACGYPDITPGRTPNDCQSNANRTPMALGIDSPNHNQSHNRSPNPTPAQTATPVERLADAAGRTFAEGEAGKGKVKSVDRLAAWKANELVTEHRDTLERIVAYAADHRAWSGEPIPLSVLVGAVLGDGHSLRQYPREQPDTPTEPDRRLTAEERAELIAQGKEQT